MIFEIRLSKGYWIEVLEDILVPSIPKSCWTKIYQYLMINRIIDKRVRRSWVL